MGRYEDPGLTGLICAPVDLDNLIVYINFIALAIIVLTWSVLTGRACEGRVPTRDPAKISLGMQACPSCSFGDPWSRERGGVRGKHPPRRLFHKATIRALLVDDSGITSILIEGPIGRDGLDLKQLRKKEGQEQNTRQA